MTALNRHRPTYTDTGPPTATGRAGSARLPRMPRPDEYLTIREAADAAHVSKRTLERWLAAGVVRAVRVGRVVRIRRADLDRALDPSARPVSRRPSRGKA